MKTAYTQKMGPFSKGRSYYYPNLKAWVGADQISNDHEGITWNELFRLLDVSM